MISAGLTFMSVSGSETFTSPLWKNIRLKVNYPSGQNSVANPIIVGDYALDQQGHAWTVEGISSVDSSNSIFTCDLLYKDGTPDMTIMPDMGGTNYGAIITPSDGGLTPWWDASYVSDAVARKAITYGIQHIATPKLEECTPKVSNSVSGNIPVFSNTEGELQDTGYAVNDDTTSDKSLWTAQKIATVASNAGEATTFEALNSNGDVGPNADQVAAGNHTHADIGNDWETPAAGGTVAVTTGDRLFVSGGTTITLPSNPSNGDTVKLIPASNWITSSAFVNPNGQKISGQSENLELNTLIGVELIYTGFAFGWAVN